MTNEEIKKFQREAYEKYRLDWMLRHNCTIKDLMTTLLDIAVEQAEENKFIMPANEQELREFAIGVKERFESDVGFNGEMYACFAEFLENEYKAPGYMRGILTESEYRKYIEATAGNAQGKPISFPLDF